MKFIPEQRDHLLGRDGATNGRPMGRNRFMKAMIGSVLVASGLLYSGTSGPHEAPNVPQIEYKHVVKKRKHVESNREPIVAPNPDPSPSTLPSSRPIKEKIGLSLTTDKIESKLDKIKNLDISYERNGIRIRGRSSYYFFSIPFNAFGKFKKNGSEIYFDLESLSVKGKKSDDEQFITAKEKIKKSFSFKSDAELLRIVEDKKQVYRQDLEE